MGLDVSESNKVTLANTEYTYTLKPNIPPPGINPRETRTNVQEGTHELMSTAVGFAIGKKKKRNLKFNQWEKERYSQRNTLQQLIVTNSTTCLNKNKGKNEAEWKEKLAQYTHSMMSYLYI